MRRLTLPLLLPLVLTTAVAVAGCSFSSSGGGGGGDADADAGRRSDRLVDFSKEPPYLNDLDVDADSGDYLLTTNRGFFRIDPETKKVSRITGRITAGGETSTVGTFLSFTQIEPGVFLGSGHPDQTGTLPQFLGFLRSDDEGKTWQVLSRLGEADLHKIVAQHDRVYAFDAVLGAILISEDGGRTFVERFTPRGLVIDFVVDPEDPKYILASTDESLFRSDDDGQGWRPVLTEQGIRLSWPAPGVLVRADKDGTVQRSDDKGATWQRIGRVPGEPYKFHELDADNLLLALSDGTIMKTADAGRTWDVAFKP